MRPRRPETVLIGVLAAVLPALAQLDDPEVSDSLRLNIASPSLYVQPGESVIVHLDVANLQQPISGAQALIGYNSAFLEAGSVAPGGGPWTELIYESWALAGEMDAAIGVILEGGPSGTQADGRIATITMTAKPVEGTAQLIFRADGQSGYATMFSDLDGNAVMPNTQNSAALVIDGTAPTTPTLETSTNCTGGPVTLTFTAADSLSGVEGYELSVDGATAGPVSSPWAVDLAAAGDGPHTLVVRAIDRAGNFADGSAATVSVDRAAPVISAIQALQNGVDVLCPAVAVRGTVNIRVTATDDGCAALLEPIVTVEGMGPASLTGYSAEFDTYDYSVGVGPGTANGPHVITVTATDELGNTVTNPNSSICINKNQITGRVELQGFVGGTRAVTFVATDGTAVLKSWTADLTGFSGGQADFTLTNAPAGMNGLSAKTAWSLRQKLACELDGGGDSIADFTGDNKLKAGDINEDNSVNILDYGILKKYWFSSNPSADLDGNGTVQVADYVLIKTNWFQVGE